MNRLLPLAVLALALLAATAGWAAPAQQGTEKNPYKSRGPMGAWVSNGKWMMRVTRVEYVADYAAFQKLPWSPRLTAAKRQEFLPYFEAELAEKQDQKLALITVEAINLTGAKAEIGTQWPIWCVRCDDGVESRFGGVSRRQFTDVDTIGQERARQVSWFLKGGMPSSDKLNPKGRTGGIIAFFIPSYAKARLLFFRWAGTNDSTWGKDESLVIQLDRKK
jgi:hypothetical protein